MADNKDKPEEIKITPEKRTSPLERAANFKIESTPEKKEVSQDDKIVASELRKEIEMMELDDNTKSEAKAKAEKIDFLGEKEKIEHLLQMAREKGLVFAIHVARQMNEPYLLDILHDTLAQEGYYKDFVSPRKDDDNDDDKKQKGISTLSGILIIIAAAVVFFGGVFAYQYFSAKPQNNKVQTNQNTQIPVNSNATDYHLLKQPRGDESTRYLDDGVVGSGTYAGYHKIIGLQIEGELGRAVAYFVFVTQDYKTFYFDPQLAQNQTYDLSLFDQTKVVGRASDIPLNHPATISLGNFVLVRQNYFTADTFDNYTIGNNPIELSNNIAGLRFFADQSTGNGFQSPNSSLHDLNSYISGITQVKITDQYGLIFNYLLVSQENHSRQVIIDQAKTYAENPFYSNADFNSGFPSYLSYDLPFPGGCGGINSSGYVLKNVSMSDLVPVGKTLSGTQLYSFRNSNNPLNQKEYKLKITNVYEAKYDGAVSAAERLNNGALEPTYAEYVAKNPIIIIKDPWNRFVALGEFQYQLMGGCGKPVIYLYPTTPTEVKVSLEKPTHFTVDIPTYKNGWDVLANPDGSLKDLQPQYTDCSVINAQVFGSEYATDACKNNVYPYLYWAGQVDNIYPQANAGWVVAKENLSSFIDQKLTIIGLNEKERADMIGYWAPELLIKNNPYYRISFFQTADMNNFAPMNIFPKPDTVIRVFLDWSSLAENNINIQPETLTHIDRKGFTVVEWGGLKQ